jgi:hypothetical protein
MVAMSEFASPVSAAFPVLVACGACGNVHDLMFVLGSSFGIAWLLALGQYVLDRIRQRLGHRRLTSDSIEAAICVSDSRVESEVRTATPHTPAPGLHSPR